MPVAPGRYSPNHHAPIFRARPDLAPREKTWTVGEAASKALVTPLCVFAPGKKEFRCIVRKLALGDAALRLIFDDLALEDHGWDRLAATITRDGTSDDHFPIWLVMRS